VNISIIQLGIVEEEFSEVEAEITGVENNVTIGMDVEAEAVVISMKNDVDGSISGI
jgi:hypothetical protein